MAYTLPAKGKIPTYIQPTKLESLINKGVTYIMPWGVVLDQNDPAGHWQAALEFYEAEKAAFCKRMEAKKLDQNKGAKTWKIKDYVVTRSTNGTYNCTCKGFMFRKQCKHVKEIKGS
jgi:hypothetical protein